MASGRDDEIRKRAHEIWENEGRPDGREKDHWERAEREMAAASAGAKAPAGKKAAGAAATKRPVKRVTKKPV